MTSSISEEQPASAPPAGQDEFKDLGFGAEVARSTRQRLHSRSSYKADEVVWGAKFANMFLRSEAGGIIGMNLDRIHDIEPVYSQ